MKNLLLILLLFLASCSVEKEACEKDCGNKINLRYHMKNKHESIWKAGQINKKKNNLRNRKPKKERINKSDTNESKIDNKTLENAIHNQLKSERNSGKNDTMIDTDLKKETTEKKDE